MTHQGLNSYHESNAISDASNLTAKEISNLIDSEHDSHLNDTQFFISIFAVIRLVLFGLYLYFEYVAGPPLYTYMHDNWLAHPYRFSNAMSQAKMKTRECLRWDGQSFLQYSIQVILMCQIMRCFGQVWSHFLCINFGVAEQIFTQQVIILMMLVVSPLLIDVGYILIHRTNPKLLFDIVNYKLQKLEFSNDPQC